MEAEHDLDEDENDPVVRTLDVFLSQNLPGIRDPAGRSDGLLLFQYPLRPKWRPLDDGWQLNKVNYRPLNQMVEMELTSEETGDEFVHKLASSNVNPRNPYAIGLLRGDQLHLTPLQSSVPPFCRTPSLCNAALTQGMPAQGVLQFRPRFDQKDEEDAIKKKTAAGCVNCRTQRYL